MPEVAMAREALLPCPRGVSGCDCGAEYCRRYQRSLGFRRAMEPDDSRPGIFANHNCWKCKDGTDLTKCPTPDRPGNCGYPHARND